MYIGIDLGTTNSLIAGFIDQGVRVFRPADGGEALPSVIYVDKRGHRLYGRRAYDQALIAPDHVASGFKRLMGTSTPIEIKGADLTLSPEECSAEILTQLLGQVTTELGTEEKIEGAIIAIPAAFNQMQSEATLRAARLAGLEHVDLLQEPVAAALAAMAGAQRSGKFVIYDLGGGTFDVALAEAKDGDVRILAQQGVNMLGGRDFDRRIVQEIVRPWLLANFDLPDAFHRDPPYRRLMRVAQLAAEKAKIDLSSLDEASIFASDDEVRLMDQNETEIFLDVPITRGQFEELIREPILKTIGVVRTLLDEAGVRPDEVDRVVYVGGPSRIPLIRRLVSEELGIPADLKTDPMTAVAVGAAWYAEGRVWGDGTTKTEDASAQPTHSKPKETQGSSFMPDEPDVSFDYAARTPDDKTVITVRVSAPLAAARQIAFECGIWKSGALPLTDQLTVMVPLPDTGAHHFTVHVMDGAGTVLPRHDQIITITRVVATASQIPAAQTVAVKTREDIAAEENILLPLVVKGMTLPTSGEVKFRSSCALRAGAPGALSFELFQVEYPERIELNLCIGVFRIDGGDLPEGVAIKAGDPVIFDWTMNDGGILQATVRLPAAGLEIAAPRFYAPQAGQVSFDKETGPLFARALLDRGDKDWGEMAAAIGPEAGPEVRLLKTRLEEQRDIMNEEQDNPEALRQVCEEARFIRQDITRIGQKHALALLQRQLGRMSAAFNRMARAYASADEASRFDADAAKVQSIIDGGIAYTAQAESAGCLTDMRRLFFAAVWRNARYVEAWFQSMSREPYLFADKAAFDVLVEKGQGLAEAGDAQALADIVRQMLELRIMVSAGSMTDELATIVKV